ncbi:MAG: MerR family transcriptional regulator [Peptococcaceae bacterium]|jgi:DNA-binding transcriptional MerR regulator|nr:MerR family transcriptional regulator [Peptococcaceae bacterium]
MKENTINETSQLLQIPKTKLRYYDQFGIVSPKRAENGYRFYSERDILDLQYAEVMKSSGFSLLEIRQVLTFKREHNPDNFPALMRIIDGKREEIALKIELYRHMLSFTDAIKDAILRTR